MECWITRIILLGCFCALVDGYAYDPESMKRGLPGYAVTVGIDRLNSTRCRTEMEEFRDSVERGVLWSLRMLDSSGEPTSGFVSGNNYWMGSRQQCEFLSQRKSLPLSDKRIKNNSIYRNPTDEFPPFQLNFFGAHIRQNGTVQYHISVPMEDVIVLGLCLPASCTEHEVGTMLKKMFEERVLLVGHLYSTDFKLIKISDLRNDHLWLLSGRMITIIFILAALLVTVVAGTLYDNLVYQKRIKKKREFLTYENNNTSELKNGGDMEDKREHVQEDAVPSELEPTSRIGQILICFSVSSNMKQIFKLGNSSEDIAVFHGLKFFGMIWIIIGHTIFYTLNITGNKAEGYIMSINIENQVLTNATLSVDTYLFISGFLLTYAYMKIQPKEKKAVSFHRNAIIFVSALVKRYIRLTPAYIITILLVIVNFSWHAKFSLWYFNEPMHDLCSKYWWRNILYINNLFEWKELCLSWSWYLSNDMQFYVFGMFLLMLSITHYYIALALSVATMVLSTFLHGYTTYAIGYIPTLDTQLETLTYMYMRPWMRIQPYMIGMGTALLLAKWDYKLHLSKKVLAIYWCLSILCNCTILFGVVNKNISLGLSVFYEAFSRLGWSLGIAWLVIACITNNAGIVNKFLSLRYWVPFSRVTLCAYLLNPFLIVSVGMFSNYSFNVDFLTTGALSIGICVVSYVCAFVLSTVAEVPVILFLRAVNTSNRRMK